MCCDLALGFVGVFDVVLIWGLRCMFLWRFEVLRGCFGLGGVGGEVVGGSGNVDLALYFAPTSECCSSLLLGGLYDDGPWNGTGICSGSYLLCRLKMLILINSLALEDRTMFSHPPRCCVDRDLLAALCREHFEPK